MASNSQCSMMSVGDIYVTREDPLSAFGNTVDHLAGADFLFGNLEGPISDRGTPLVGKVEVGSACLRAPLRAAQPLIDIGFSAVTVANNHAMDYGADALEQTIDILRGSSIGVTGGGHDLAAARTPWIGERGGTSIAMLGYTTVFPMAGFAATDDRAGLSTIRVATSYQAPHSVPYQPGTPAITVTVPDANDVRRLRADIRGARDRADLVVVQFHWGVAGYAHPLGYMKELGRLAVDFGAHLVIGNGPHVLLGAEIYDGVLICYNLNHFAIDVATPWPGGLDAVILTSSIDDKRFTSHSFVMTTIDERSRSLSMATPDRVIEIKSLLEGLSGEFGTTFEPDGFGLAVGGPVEGTPRPQRAREVYYDPARSVAAGWGTIGGPDVVLTP